MIPPDEAIVDLLRALARYEGRFREWAMRFPTPPAGLPAEIMDALESASMFLRAVVLRDNVLLEARAAAWREGVAAMQAAQKLFRECDPAIDSKVFESQQMATPMLPCRACLYLRPGSYTQRNCTTCGGQGQVPRLPLPPWAAAAKNPGETDDEFIARKAKEAGADETPCPECDGKGGEQYDETTFRPCQTCLMRGVVRK